jgi:prevent-host-death family protein
MVTEVNAVNFRQNLGEMLNQVQYRNDSIVINKDGKPVAALVDAELLATLTASQANYLITGDKHLLALAEKYPVISPATFWARHG